MTAFYLFRVVCGLFLTAVILSTAYDIRKRMIKQQQGATGDKSIPDPMKLTNLKPIGSQMTKNSEKEINNGTLQITEGQSMQQQTNVYVVEVSVFFHFSFF